MAYGPREETIVGAPLHFILIFLVFPVLLVLSRTRESRWLVWVVLAMALGYCAVVMWQPWGARLQQPIFAVGILMVAAVVGGLPDRLQRFVIWAVMLGAGVVWWPSREAAARPLWTSPTVFQADRETISYIYWPLLQERDAALSAIIKAAGVHDVMIVSEHDIPYLLMSRMALKTPDVHFHGAPASDMEYPPGAIVVLHRLRPQALYHSLPGGERYRLVGDSYGDGIYLPEVTVDTLGWRKRLPAFAGWSEHEGLRFRTVDVASVGQLLVWWEMEDEWSQVVFRAWGPMHCELSVMAEGSQDESLTLILNGRPVQRLELPAHYGRLDFFIPLASTHGLNRLEFKRTTRTRGSLRFVQLILNDGDVPMDTADD